MFVTFIVRQFSPISATCPGNKYLEITTCGGNIVIMRRFNKNPRHQGDPVYTIRIIRIIRLSLQNYLFKKR